MSAEHTPHSEPYPATTAEVMEQMLSRVRELYTSVVPPWCACTDHGKCLQHANEERAEEALSNLSAHFTRLEEQFEAQERELLDTREDRDATLESLREAKEQHEALCQAVTRIVRTPVYEERGKPESGISIAMLAAMREAATLAGVPAYVAIAESVAAESSPAMRPDSGGSADA